MRPPLPFAFPTPAALIAAAVKADQRATELRALTGMSHAEAIQWLTVLSGIQATSLRETHDSAWETFRRAIMEGGTPVAAAAYLVERMRRP